VAVELLEPLGLLELLGPKGNVGCLAPNDSRPMT
jgi:hypothetical protein